MTEPLDPDDPVVRSATLGRVVEDFMDGPIGTLLEEKAKAEELDAVTKLITVDPEDPKEIRRLQNQALVAGKILEWLAETVQQGHMALDKLKDDYGD